MSEPLGRRRPRVAVTTLGCKVNQYDSEALLGLFTRAGYDVVPAHEEADVYLINTCVVTGRATAKSRQLVHRVTRDHPGAIVAVVGCYSETEPEEVRHIPGVGVVVGTRDRDRLVDLVEEARRSAGAKEPKGNRGGVGAEAVGTAGPWRYEEMPIAGFHGRTRATVKIQEGCDQYCSYCIIPYARGPIRSRHPEDVVAEVRRMAAAGFKEVVLTGIHLGAYGRDFDGTGPATDLAGVIGRLAGVPGLGRVRLSSIEPMEITPALVDLIVGGLVCRHLHVPLQSGSARTLAAMNRQYTPADYRRVIDEARARIPGLAVSTDMMVGFPGESEADFDESYAFTKSMGFSRLHVFKYSRRQGTPAAGMPGQISSVNKAARSARLIALGEEMGRAFVQSQLGSTVGVLVEAGETDEVGEGVEPGKGRPHRPCDGSPLGGLSDNYIRVEFPGPEAWTNQIVPVHLEMLLGPGAAAGRAVNHAD